MLGVESVFVVPREKRKEASNARAMFASPHGTGQSACGLLILLTMIILRMQVTIYSC